MQAWINTLPPGASRLIENGYDYTGYQAKPFALRYAMESGAAVAILVDASFYPIRSIQPLVEHIVAHGYFLCRNGHSVGEWTSGRCLELMGMQRDEAIGIEDVSSYCVGVQLRRRDLVDAWACRSTDAAVAGPHTNSRNAPMPGQRNPGMCSNDPRCKGHRHDQSVLSILRYRLGLTELVSRPKFTAYKGTETEETVMVCQGLGMPNE